jgi:UDP-2,3-diacylglucosamine pyrophosphatase LpxH
MKKKIKLIVSDLHLGLGHILPNGHINSLEEFYYDQKFVEFLHFYSTGPYVDFEVELILNGDILNLMQVDYRGHYLTVVTEAISLDKTRRIVAGHPQFFEGLRRFAAHPSHSITYVVGNHDQGVMWPAVREYLTETIGSPVRFKNLVYFFDGVHVEHGHMHEAANRLDPKKFFLKKDLPEPILNLPFGSHFFLDFVMKIKQTYPHVDKIRPFGKMLRWSLFNETWFTIKGFFGLVLFFIRSIFARDPRKNWGFQKLFKIALESAVFPDLSESARRILLDQRVHTVIFGHTHVYQYRQWSDDMEYFNTGTWTEVTSLEVATLGKMTKLTYVFVEYPEDQERPLGRLKEWHGYHRVEQDVAIS